METPEDRPRAEEGFIVTIDGPAGAGKSTVARALAERLAFRYLDTGAMYRAVTLAALEAEIPLDAGQRLGDLARELELTADDEGRTRLGSRNVSAAIRTDEVTRNVSEVSAHPPVREAMMVLQRRVGAGARLVCEGRDMGTVVFPEAPLKIYLDADVRTRARRRALELEERGVAVDLADVERKVADRDRADSTREAAPLRRQDDQVHVNTSGLSVEEVLARLEALVRDRFPDDARATGGG